MDNLTIVTIVLGLIIGSIMLTASTYVYVKHRVFSVGGSVLTAFGTLLLGLSIWQSVEFTVGPDGAVTASFKQQLDDFKKEVNQEIEGSNKAITEELSVLRTEFQSSATESLSDDALSRLQTKEKIDSLLEDGKYLEALKYDPKNTIAIMRYIREQVSKAEFKKATDYYEVLVDANSAGVGYSVYPNLILAFDHQGQNADAQKLVQELELRYKSDIAKGYGYYARAQQLSWLDRDLASTLANLKNNETKRKVEELMGNIQDTIKVLRG